jgi:hypothetical protein
LALEEIPSHCLATLGGLHLFPFLMTAEQVTQLIETPWEILDNAILSSDRIAERSRKNSLRFPRSAHIQMTFFGQRLVTSEIVVSVNYVLAAGTPLIDVLAIDNGCNEICAFFGNAGESSLNHELILLDILGQFFARSEQTQRRFTRVSYLESWFRQNPKYLSTSLYFSICNVFAKITYPRLRTEWFQRLILHLWLWSKGDNFELCRIIHHWSHVLIPNCGDLFKSHSYFSQLLNQYLIFFA